MTRAWFEDADRLTPDELLNVTFSLSRLGRRGYEEGPVRKFLSGVHQGFMRLVKERRGMGAHRSSTSPGSSASRAGHRCAGD